MELVYISKAEKKFHSYALHSHTVWEIMLIVEGSGVITIGGNQGGNQNQKGDQKRYPVRQGSVLCIPPGMVHASYSEEGMRDFCAGYKDFPVFQKKDLKILQDKTGDFEHLMDMILRTVQLVPSNQKELLDALGHALAQLLMSMFDDGENNRTVVWDLKHVIMEHLSDPDFDPGKAMRETGFSEGYLRRQFHEATGMAPVQWMNRQRIEYARRLLSQYAALYTIRQVASMTGFSDPYYFSRVFRQYTGTSPREFRNQYRQSGTPPQEDYRNTHPEKFPEE